MCLVLYSKRSSLCSKAAVKAGQKYVTMDTVVCSDPSRMQRDLPTPVFPQEVLSQGTHGAIVVVSLVSEQINRTVYFSRS